MENQEETWDDNFIKGSLCLKQNDRCLIFFLLLKWIILHVKKKSLYLPCKNVA